jgi:hypothetical protein
MLFPIQLRFICFLCHVLGLRLFLHLLFWLADSRLATTQEISYVQLPVFSSFFFLITRFLFRNINLAYFYYVALIEQGFLYQERQCMSKPTIDAPSCNLCCSGKSVIVTYSECVILALATHHATRMRHNIICGLPGSTIF